MPLNVEKRKIQGLEILEVAGDPEAPAVLLFHGYGADAYDLLPLSKSYQGKTNLRFFFPTGPIEIPIAPGYSGRGWFPINIETIKEALHEGDLQKVSKSFENELAEAREMCNNLIAELNIPLSKLFIGGFSQGAILATDIALHAFENVAALILFSGIITNENAWAKLASNRKGTPFFQSHGEEDTLLPFTLAKSLEKLLLDAGFKGKLHSFRGGHEIPYSTIVKLNVFLNEQMKLLE
jgi:phospholipase/carboxylesterase